MKKCIKFLAAVIVLVAAINAEAQQDPEALQRERLQKAAMGIADKLIGDIRAKLPIRIDDDFQTTSAHRSGMNVYVTYTPIPGRPDPTIEFWKRSAQERAEGQREVLLHYKPLFAGELCGKAPISMILLHGINWTYIWRDLQGRKLFEVPVDYKDCRK